MGHFQIFQVLPNLPESLAFLEALSRNIWWSWQHEAIGLFRRIEPGLWKESGRNPIVFLTNIPQKRMEELAVDEGFLTQLRRVEKNYEKGILEKTDENESRFKLEGPVAYFSMEYGIHESIPLFSGGLGILAGDHLKAASDMKFPLVAVGLLYRQGYFRQFLNQEGWQQEEYPETDIFYLPLERAQDEWGNEVRISIQGLHGKIHASVWKINVGNIPLYLLDTNVPENPPDVREITSRLYGGGSKMRLAQEVLLGIGGMRTLSALGIDPTVCHMNEGHSAAFARRFATYKRASLLFHDLERLEALVNSKEYPVQFIFAGKAHPKDDEGKRMIQYLVQTARRKNFRHRIIFLEDYDIHIARLLVQGADVWLNTPRRPLEASGTSGMKAAINGVLNLSILDGWWNEAYTPEAGWCIGRGEEYSDHAYQDGVDSQALYNMLENSRYSCFQPD